MEKRLIIRKAVAVVLAVTILISMNMTSVCAADTVDIYNIIDNAKAGEKFLNPDGCLEIVVRANKDGSFITEEFNESSLQIQKAKCSHPTASLVAIAELTPKTKNIGKSYCCFKYRSVTKYRCKKCGRTIKLHGVWKEHKKHSFPLFGKTCKTCGYKK